MGNKPKRSKPWHDVCPQPIADPVPGGGGGVVVDEEMPSPSWTVVLEDLTPATDGLQPDVAVRAAWAAPRFGVHAGRALIGFVPARLSAEIKKAMDAGGGGVLQGHVVSVDLAAGRVIVVLVFEGS